MKNVTAAKFELAFTRCRKNLKTVRDLTVRNSLQDFDAKEAYLHSKSRSISFQKCLKMFGFIIFRWLHDAVSKMCRLECRFQNLPAKNVPFSCEQEAYPSNFSPFSKCAGIV